MEMITLTCSECKGTLQVDSDKMLIQCPYCGKGKLIIEDKEITLKRLELQKQKLEMEEKEREYQREKEDNEPFTIREIFGMAVPIVLSFLGMIAAFAIIFYLIRLGVFDV